MQGWDGMEQTLSWKCQWLIFGDNKLVLVMWVWSWHQWLRGRSPWVQRWMLSSGTGTVGGRISRRSLRIARWSVVIRRCVHRWGLMVMGRVHGRGLIIRGRVHRRSLTIRGHSCKESIWSQLQSRFSHLVGGIEVEGAYNPRTPWG